MISRRHVLAGAIAAPALLKASRGQAAQTLKISHQFPGGTIDQGDFRDRLCRKFAQEIAKRTNGALVAEVYPNSSLMKTNAQFSAMRKGALDMSLYPMPYAGGELPELNIGLMPCLVSSYSQGAAWKNSDIGREIRRNSSPTRGSSWSPGYGRRAAARRARTSSSGRKTPRDRRSAAARAKWT